MRVLSTDEGRRWRLVTMCSHGGPADRVWGQLGQSCQTHTTFFSRVGGGGVKLEVQHLSAPGDVSIVAEVSISSPSLERVTRPGARPSRSSPPSTPASCSEEFPTAAGGRPRPRLLRCGDILHRSGIAGGSEGSQSPRWGGQRKYNPDARQGPDLLFPPTSLIILQPDQQVPFVSVLSVRVFWAAKRDPKEMN